MPVKMIISCTYRPFMTNVAMIREDTRKWRKDTTDMDPER